MSSIIGYLHLDAREKVFRTFEYAGAGEIWNLHAACVKVVTSDSPGFALYSQPGERIDSWFQNHIGACYGSDNRDTTVVPGNYGMQADFFSLGQFVQEGRMTLCDGWELYEYDDTYSDGSPIVRVVKSKG